MARDVSAFPLYVHIQYQLKVSFTARHLGTVVTSKALAAPKPQLNFDLNVFRNNQHKSGSKYITCGTDIISKDSHPHLIIAWRGGYSWYMYLIRGTECLTLRNRKFKFSFTVFQTTHLFSLHQSVKGQLICDGTSAETRFRLSAKRTSPFKSAEASVQSTTGSRGVRISGNNAGYTMFRGSVKGTGYTLHSPVSPSLPLPCVTVCHHISTGVYLHFCMVQYPLVDQGLPILETSRSHSDTPHSVRLPWTSDQPEAEKSTWRHSTLKTDIHAFQLDRTRNPSKRAKADPRLP